MSQFTRDQVATHNTVDDAWVILYGKVYNITNFLNSHPGGKDILLKHLGQDITSVFDLVDAHIEQSDNIDNFLIKINVGVVTN